MLDNVMCDKQEGTALQQKLQLQCVLGPLVDTCKRIETKLRETTHNPDNLDLKLT